MQDFVRLVRWGDAESMRAAITLQQPAMDPVFSGTRSTADLLIAVAKKDAAVAARFTDADYRAWLFKRLPGSGNAQTMAAAWANGMLAGASSAGARPAAASSAVAA